MDTYRLHRAMSGLFFVYNAAGERVGYLAGSRGAWEAMTEAGEKLGRLFPSQQSAAVALTTQANGRNL